MKILLVTYYGLKRGGGIATATQMLAQKWLTDGDEVAIASFEEYQFNNLFQLTNNSQFLTQKNSNNLSKKHQSSPQKSSANNFDQSSFIRKLASNFHWYHLPNIRLCPNFAHREEILIRRLTKILTDFQPDVVEATDLRFVGSAAICATRNFNTQYRLPHKLSPIKILTDYRDYWFACPKGDLLFQNQTLCSGMNLKKCLHCLQGQNPPCWIRQKYDFIRSRRQILNLADQKLVVSQTVLEIMKKNHLATKTTVVYDTILDSNNPQSTTSVTQSQSSPAITSNFFPSHPAEILFVGKLIYHRGINLILELANLAQLQNLPVHFTLIGNGPLRALIFRQIRQLHLTNISLTGALQPSALANFYQTADLVIFPTQIQEPFSRAVLEALFAHKIILASDLGGLREIIISNKNGWLLPPDQPQLWLDKIKLYITHPELRARLQISSQKIFETNLLFQPDHYFAKIKEIYTTSNGKQRT